MNDSLDLVLVSCDGCGVKWAAYEFTGIYAQVKVYWCLSCKSKDARRQGHLFKDGK